MNTRSTNKNPEKRIEAVLANIDFEMAAVVAAIIAERRADGASRRPRPSVGRREHVHAN